MIKKTQSNGCVFYINLKTNKFQLNFGYINYNKDNKNPVEIFWSKTKTSPNGLVLFWLPQLGSNQ